MTKHLLFYTDVLLLFFIRSFIFHSFIYKANPRSEKTNHIFVCPARFFHPDVSIVEFHAIRRIIAICTNAN